MAASEDTGFGISHLAETPVTASFGLSLLGVLIVLILLRLVFADVGGSVHAGGGVR